jgi:phage terminase small subunit
MQPDKDLTPAAQAEWKRFSRLFEVDDDAALVLREYVLAGERLELAREALRHDGLMLGSPVRLHPAAAAARDAQSIRLRCLRALGLPIADKKNGRPDDVERSRRGRKPAPRPL